MFEYFFQALTDDARRTHWYGNSLLRPCGPGELKIEKGSNSVKAVDSVMIFAFCTSADGPLSRYQFSFLYFQRYAPDKLFIAKIKKGSNSVKIVDRVTILVLCASANGLLSMYQVPYNSLLYFQRYATDNLFIAKTKKGVTPCILLTEL